MKKARKIISLHIFIALGFFILFSVWKCPIKFIFSKPCPTCGMTKAWKSAIKLDLVSAVRYHPLFIVAPPLMFYIFHEKMFNFKKRTKNITFISVGILFFIVYIIRYLTFGKLF